MKTTWKSYFVFLSTSYKIWGMIFFPMVILGITELFIYANRLGGRNCDSCFCRLCCGI